MAEPTQLRVVTGFLRALVGWLVGRLAQDMQGYELPHLKNMMDETTTATRFMVFPTEKLTAETPVSRTM